MLYRHVFDKISTEFHGIFRVFVNFADLPEFHGSATVWNIRSPVIYKYQYLQCCKEHFCGSSGSNNFNSLAVLSNFHPGELHLPQDNAGKWNLTTLLVKQQRRSLMYLPTGPPKGAALTINRDKSTASCHSILYSSLSCSTQFTNTFCEGNSLRSKRFWASSSRTSGREQKKKGLTGEGKEGTACPQTPRFGKTAFAHERSFWLVRSC